MEHEFVFNHVTNLVLYLSSIEDSAIVLFTCTINRNGTLIT